MNITKVHITFLMAKQIAVIFVNDKHLYHSVPQVPKTKIACNLVSYTLFIYGYLSLFIRSYFASSKVTSLVYQLVTTTMVQIWHK